MPARIALSLMVIPVVVNKLGLVVENSQEQAQHGLGNGQANVNKDGLLS